MLGRLVAKVIAMAIVEREAAKDPSSVIRSMLLPYPLM